MKNNILTFDDLKSPVEVFFNVSDAAFLDGKIHRLVELISENTKVSITSQRKLFMSESVWSHVELLLL